MSRAADEAPEERLGYLAKHAHLRLEALVDDALAPLDLDARELGILLAIADGEPRSQQEVAGRLGIDRTTMVARIDDLERKKIVSRRPDPNDRRRNVVELTSSGDTLVARAVAASDDAAAEWLAPLDAAAAGAFRAALKAVVFPPV